MTINDEMPSIKTAVALEERRRKRVFATFLALLLIPVAIGAYAILKASTETEVLVRNATPIIEKSVEKSVSQKVDRTIEPRVEEIVERRAAPVIARTLEKSVVARVEPIENNYRIRGAQDKERIDALEKRIELLEQQLAALKTRPRPEVQLERPLTRVPKPVPQ